MAEANGKSTTPTEVEEDFYDDATENFPSVDDLVPLASGKNPETVGRLVAIWALENGSAQGEKEPYPFTETVTLVLDDGPDGDQVTDLVGPAPVELKLRHSTKGIQSRIGPRVDGWTRAKRNDAGEVTVPSVPMKWRPMIGRVNTKPSTLYKKGSPAVSISLPTDADRAIIEKHKALIKEINARMEAKDADNETAQAFS